MNHPVAIYASLRMAGLTALTALACASVYGGSGSAQQHAMNRVLATTASYYYVDANNEAELRRQLALAIADADRLDPDTLACLQRLFRLISPNDAPAIVDDAFCSQAPTPAVGNHAGATLPPDVGGAPVRLLTNVLEPRGP